MEGATVDGVVSSTALLDVRDSWGAPAMTLARAQERYDALKQFCRSNMRRDVDFGALPGTDKPTLLKPGAEKLAKFFGLRPVLTCVNAVENWGDDGKEPLFNYVYSCAVYGAGDDYSPVATSEASCSSRESKYRYRKGKRRCPECGQESIVPQKGRPGFVCWAKLGGCGFTYAGDDERITKQALGRVINEDVADLSNTVRKMAQKRALVGTILIAVNASEFFTQDMEDGGITDAAFTPEVPADLLGSLQVLLTMLYGEKVKTKQAELAKYVSGGRVDTLEGLSLNEVSTLIDKGMVRLRAAVEKVADSPTPEPLAGDKPIEEENPEEVV